MNGLCGHIFEHLQSTGSISLPGFNHPRHWAAK